MSDHPTPRKLAELRSRWHGFVSEVDCLENGQQDIDCLLTYVEALQEENQDLRQWRTDVTAAVIHSSEKNAGGLFYDEVVPAIGKLRAELASLKEERGALKKTTCSECGGGEYKMPGFEKGAGHQKHCLVLYKQSDSRSKLKAAEMRVAELEKASRDLIDVLDHPKEDGSGLWLIYDLQVGAAFNWYAFGPRLKALRAALAATEKEKADGA